MEVTQNSTLIVAAADVEQGSRCVCMEGKQSKSYNECEDLNRPFHEEDLESSSIHLLSLTAALLATLTFLLLLLYLRLSNPANSTASSPSTTSSGALRFDRPQQQLAHHYLEDEEQVGHSWENLKGAEHCLRYATRQYTARLIDVPSDASGIRLCRETPAEIHGILLLPDFCQDLGLAGGVWGYWTISFEEPACWTSWGDFIDMGCDDQGRALMTRRFEAALENMQHGDNWQIMCTTTPAELKGFHFPTPTMCEKWGREGVWGIWEVDDLSCTTPS